MRRPGPRPLAAALGQVATEVAPVTLLARVQRHWPDAAGQRVAGEAEPVAERGAVVTVACRSAAWAQELALLSGELTARLNDGLVEADGRRPLRGLRFVTRSGAARS